MKHPLEQYAYDYPESAIGKTPAEPRDHARLFVYDTATDTITFDYFYNLATHVPDRAVMVMNDTGVIPARVGLRKDTGKVLDSLVLMNEGFDADGAIPVITNRQLFPGRRVAIGEEYWFTVARQDGQKFYLKPEFDARLIPELLERYGTTPTPYYLGKLGMDENQLRTRYQTVFAGEKKSVAAPTASLHFTDRVFETLDARGVVRATVTLDVGLGTFQEIAPENVAGKYLHQEQYRMSAADREMIADAKSHGRPIVAVGTTVVRTLESAADQILHGTGPISDATTKFIMPPYAFALVDALVTNFHVPKSSLMALVDAFLQHRGAKRGIGELYRVAIENGFRLFSFGDAMLIK